jgi:hypothetical protein
LKKLLRLGSLPIIVILFIAFLLMNPGTQETNAFVQATLEETELTNPDAEIYTENSGISLDEANRQFRISDTTRILQADLIANEADTLAGLWIEHSPKFRFVQMGGGEVPAPTYLGLVSPLPKNCPGPYWLVSEFVK